jgi:hypothetical protein
MKNNNGPCYNVKVHEFIAAFSAEKKAEYQELLDEGDHKAIEEFLQDELAKLDLPVPSHAYVATKEDEDLEIGEIYAVFPESALFIKKESEQYQRLKIYGIKPEIISHFP